MDGHGDTGHEAMAATIEGISSIMHQIDGYGASIAHDMLVGQDPFPHATSQIIYGDTHTTSHPHSELNPHDGDDSDGGEAASGQEGQQRLTIAAVDARATKNDAAWTQHEEAELVRLVTDESYRKSVLGVTSTKWAPVAQYFSRTVKAVKRKFDKLNNPEKEFINTKKAQQTRAARRSGHPIGPNHMPVGMYIQNGIHQPQQGGGFVDMMQLHAAATGWAPVVDVHGHPISLPFPMTAVVDTMTMDNNTAEHGIVQMQQQQQQQVQGISHEQMMLYYHQQQAFGAMAANGNNTIDHNGSGELDANQTMMHMHVFEQQQQQQQQTTVATAPSPVIDSTTTATNEQPPQQQKPRNDGVFWKIEEQEELAKLVQDEDYRQQILNTKDLNWELIATHIGRKKRSVQRKWDNIKSVLDNGGSIKEGALKDKKKWSPEDVAELMKLVEDEAYRKQKLNIEKVDWRVLGQHFGRPYDSVAYKYNYEKNAASAAGNTRATASGAVKKRHMKPKATMSYKAMAVWALVQLGGRGTSNQMCSAIEQNAEFVGQLDTSIVSGKKTLPRWKHGIRSALTAFQVFSKTSDMYDGEVVWMLAPVEPASAKKKEKNQSATLLVSSPTDEAGVDVLNYTTQQQQQLQAVENQGPCPLATSPRGGDGRKRKNDGGDDYNVAHNEKLHDGLADTTNADGNATDQGKKRKITAEANPSSNVVVGVLANNTSIPPLPPPHTTTDDQHYHAYFDPTTIFSHDQLAALHHHMTSPVLPPSSDHTYAVHHTNQHTTSEAGQIGYEQYMQYHPYNTQYGEGDQMSHFQMYTIPVPQSGPEQQQQHQPK